MLNSFINKMWQLKKLAPGLTLALLIGLSGRYLGIYFPKLGGVTAAILLGLIIGNIFEIKDSYKSGINFAEKKLLALAIMLMGLKLELKVLSDLGAEAIIIIIIIMVASTIIFGLLYGRLTGLNTKLSLLLGVGNAICGSSAIAAVAPVLDNKEEEIGLSIGVVNLLGTIGIFLLPQIARLVGFTDKSSALMIGGTLQAVGQVVAAGFSMNEAVGRIATVVKMGRILMLGPIVLFFSFFFSKRGEESKDGKGVNIPKFIIGFFIFSLIGSIGVLPVELADLLKALSKFVLIIAMAAIGLKIKVASLFEQGPKALLVSVLVFASQIILSIILINLFY